MVGAPEGTVEAFVVFRRGVREQDSSGLATHDLLPTPIAHVVKFLNSPLRRSRATNQIDTRIVIEREQSQKGKSSWGKTGKSTEKCQKAILRARRAEGRHRHERARRLDGVSAHVPNSGDARRKGKGLCTTTLPRGCAMLTFPQPLFAS